MTDDTAKAEQGEWFYLLQPIGEVFTTRHDAIGTGVVWSRRGVIPRDYAVVAINNREKDVAEYAQMPPLRGDI